MNEIKLLPPIDLNEWIKSYKPKRKKTDPSTWRITPEMCVVPTEAEDNNESQSVTKHDSNNTEATPIIKTDKPKGKGRGRRKLTEPAVRSIRIQADNGVSKEILAKQHNVSQTCIHNIVKRNTWKHVV